MMELSIREVLMIVESSGAAEWRSALAYVCIFALLAIVLGSIVAYAVRKLDAVRKRDKVFAVVFSAASLMLALYAGVSDNWDFVFPAETGIYDAGSWIDEETGEIHAFWDYEPWASSYKMKWFYTYKYGGESRGPYELPDVDVTRCHAEYTLPTAGDDWESVIVTCYTEYVRPIHVVTNGVYHVDGVMRSIDSTNSPMPKYVTPGISILADLSDETELFLAPVTNAAPVPASAMSSPQNPNEGE